MPKTSDIQGTSTSSFRIGLGAISAILKNLSNGAIALRNASDTADIGIRAYRPKAQLTASRSLTLSDANTQLFYSGTTAIAITVPSNLIPANSEIEIVQLGTGVVTIAPDGGGLTINGGNNSVILSQNSGVSLNFYSPNNCVALGGAQGGSVSFPIAIAQGGTGATDAATALTNLGAVASSDPRLSDARTPIAHNQAWTTITGTPTTIAGYGISDAVASNDARLSDQRIPIDGSVTNAKIAANAAIAWEKIDKSGAVPSDVGVIQTYQAIGNTPPASPANGDRWMELNANGFPIEDWVWDSTNSRWISINKYAASWAQQASINATTTLRIPLSIPGTYSQILIERVDAIVGCVNAHNSTNHYTISWRTFGTAASFAISGINDQNTQTLPANSPTVYFQNTSVVPVSGISSFALLLTRTGTPAAIWVSASFTLRKIR